MIGVSTPYRHALEASGQTPPKPVIGTFLVDTGATGTCIDAEFARRLQFPIIGPMDMETSTTNGQAVTCMLFDASLLIPSDDGVCLSVDAMPVIEAHLQSHGLDGLIGRDVLSRCVLIYNGASNIVTLAG